MHTILVVEDCPINRFFLEKGLSSKGYHVTTTSNGQEALNWLKQHSAALVLMDVQMPVLDGLQTTKAIRKLQNSASALPVIAITALTSERERERCLEAGMDEVLAKPIVLAELCERIKAVTQEQPLQLEQA